MTDFPSETAINDALEKIFAQPEFHSFVDEFYERVLAQIIAWLFERLAVFNLGSFNMVPIIIFALFLLLLVSGAVLLILTVLRRT